MQFSVETLRTSTGKIYLKKKLVKLRKAPSYICNIKQKKIEILEAK